MEGGRLVSGTADAEEEGRRRQGSREAVVCSSYMISAPVGLRPGRRFLICGHSESLSRDPLGISAYSSIFTVAQLQPCRPLELIARTPILVPIGACGIVARASSAVSSLGSCPGAA